MRKLFTLLALSVMCILAISYGESTKKAVIPVNPTDPTSGKQMYVNYCHGVDGRGHGPVSFALKAQPFDLTALARNNHGRYPDAHVASVLQFGSSLPAHGSLEMPVWGPILGNMNHGNPQERSLRIVNLNDYIRSLQTR
jgi:hypothetical protein